MTLLLQMLGFRSRVEAAEHKSKRLDRLEDNDQAYHVQIVSTAEVGGLRYERIAMENS